MDMHFVNPEDLPPGFLEMLRKQHDMHEMSHVDQSHQIAALVRELDADQLITLRMLLALTGGREGLSGYFQGMITQRLQEAHGVCLCGERHDPSELLNEEQPVEKSNSKIEPGSAQEQDVTGNWDPELLERYNLEVVDDDTKHELRCKGCKTYVFSLEDRMLRPPGVKGCENCQHIAKWG